MKRYKHSLSYTNLLSCDMGELIPCGLTEVLPGDTLQQATNALIRVSPLVTPVMHPVQVRIHHWFVPHRIVWDGFEDFITGGPDGNDGSTVPKLTGSVSAGDMLDYMGVPPGTSDVSALPVRAVNKIWNEFYRDQDLQTERGLNDTSLPRICWEKDPFTSSRPFSQKGPSVTIPIGTRAPVRGIGIVNSAASEPHSQKETGGIDETAPGWNVGASQNLANVLGYFEDPDNPGYPEIYADLASAESVDVTDFRRAFALQRYQEARARYGSRYTEYLAYLGVQAADARLQRPEYLGGGKQMISFSEVLGTYDGGTDETALGRMGGHGIAALRSNRYRKFFNEHGYVITMLSVRPKTMYANGVPRHFLRTHKEDFFQKELEAIGQQEVLNREVFAQAAVPDGTFGWQNRYEEYRRNWSLVSGEMRDVLDSWHLARDFEAEPALNAEFVECNPSKRIYAAQTNDVLWVTVNHQIQARRMVNKLARSKIL